MRDKDKIWAPQYEKYNWKVWGDLKAIVLFLGLQLNYRKFCCFLRAWDSRYRKYDYIQKQWQKRESVIPGQEYVANTILINTEKSLFPSVAHQTWTNKNFVKAWIKIALDLCI